MCLPLVKPNNTQYSHCYTSVQNYHDYCYYQCEVGFYISEPKKTQCIDGTGTNAVGSWSNTGIPSCQSMYGLHIDSPPQKKSMRRFSI